MIPGITASERRKHSGGGGSYSASAVTFGGTTSLLNSSLVSVDNHFISFAGWFRPTSGDFSGTGVPFMVNPNNGTNLSFDTGTTQLLFVATGTRAGGGPGHSEMDYLTTVPNVPLVAGNWCHVIGSFDGTDTYPPARPGKLYVNDIDSQALVQDASDSLPLTLNANGLPMWVGTDNDGDPYSGSMADFSFWPGVSFLLESGGTDIPLDIRRLFIDASGAPVNPATAIASLGTPAVMLSGNASTFPSNSLGGGGSFTTTAGGLTNDFSTVHL